MDKNKANVAMTAWWMIAAVLIAVTITTGWVITTNITTNGNVRTTEIQTLKK